MTGKQNFKFKEDYYLDEVFAYIKNTYGEHYSQNKFQSTEVIIDRGHGTGFCMGNIDKYSNRYGKKGETPEEWRKDIMKVIHYGIIMLYVHDQEYAKNETDPIKKN